MSEEIIDIVRLVEEYFHWLDCTKRWPGGGFAGTKNEKEKELRKFVRERRKRMANTNTLLIIDCSQLCYRAYHTMGELSYNEKKTGVLFGFLAQVFKLAKDFDTKRFVFCWDSKKSFREEIYPDYKKSRHNKDLTKEERYDLTQMFRQRDELRRSILPKLGFKNSFIKTGLEADDLITYIVDQNGGTVVSSDNDLWQLLDVCTIYNPNTRDRITELDLIEQQGVNPIQWVEVKAIAGCDSDEVKGIEGVGIKTAIKYINDGLPDGKIKKRIESDEGKAIIERNYRLVELPFMDDTTNIGDLNNDEKFMLDDWLEVFNKYRFNYFLKKENLTKYKEIFELI